jgi:hypothetical protein
MTSPGSSHPTPAGPLQEQSVDTRDALPGHKRETARPAEQTATAPYASIRPAVGTITKSAGHIIVDALVAHGVKRAHVVPRESFLDVLDGLHGSPIETIVCRHAGGATYMAEADGKMNQMPGIAMVTRGPGAANAHVGLHTAWQDSTPMVLFVGLIPFAHRVKQSGLGREGGIEGIGEYITTQYIGIADPYAN